MVRNLLRKNKKGVSLMVGYVLLIVIAVGLSVAVFSYLRLYLPKEEPKCYDDVSLTIEQASCANQLVDVTLRNRGLFNISGAHIRIGDPGRIAKELLNPSFLFDFGGGVIRDLKPGEEWSPPGKYSYTYPAPASQELEIEPVVFIDNKPILCPKAVVKRIIFCSLSP